MANAAKARLSVKAETKPGKARSAHSLTHEPVAAARAKAEFLGLIHQVSTDSRPVIVTRRGKPIVQIAPLETAVVEDPFGCLRGSVQTHGDVVGPEPDAWEATA